MNPNSTASPIPSPQTINKSSGNTVMVGMLLASSGSSVPTSHPLVGTHTMGPLGGERGGPMPPPPVSTGLPPSPPKQVANGGSAPSSTAPSAGGSFIQSTTTMANMKEKTPMCLINELARFNKVQHQYRLVDESGPPHKKTFTVVLKLDAEEYTASGASIKKAQHAAAAIALDQTSLKHPPPKSQRKSMGPITPTVELNALAMKQGEPTVYQLIEPQRPQYIPNLNFRGMYHQRYHYPKTPVYYVSLKVGNRQFFGEGRTAQAARHAAAEEALAVLRNLPYPDSVKKPVDITPPPPPPSPPLATSKVNGELSKHNEDESDDLKSPVSLVHEIALKRSLVVNFEVTRESGPPHMRTFITKCSVGDILTEGEGNGKKISKKRAAEKMLEELKKLPPLPPTQQKVKKKPVVKKKNRNLIKEQKSDPQYGQGINPISRLIQIQQAKKEKEPVYTVIDEKGEPRQREFVMQCSLGDVSTIGGGPNKKTAKRNAAESMLQVMGYSRAATTPGKSAVKGSGIDASHIYPSNQDMEKGRKVTFSDQDGDKLEADYKLGRQLVPGLLLMPDKTELGADQTSLKNYPSIGNPNLNRAPGGPIQHLNKMAMQTTIAIAKELLESGVSPTAEALRKSQGHQPLVPLQTPLLRPQDQLRYLADVLGLHVHFTDFPKGSKVEYLSLVSLSLNPPFIKHGAGSSIEASHDQAARILISSLAELGHDAATEKVDTKLSIGDGIYISGHSPPSKLTNSVIADVASGAKGGSSLPLAASDSH